MHSALTLVQTKLPELSLLNAISFAIEYLSPLSQGMYPDGFTIISVNMITSLLVHWAISLSKIIIPLNIFIASINSALMMPMHAHLLL